MKKGVPQKGPVSNQKVETVHEEFTGKNLTRFRGVGLIRRFLKGHQVAEKIEQRVTVEGRRECKYRVSAILVRLPKKTPTLLPGQPPQISFSKRMQHAHSSDPQYPGTDRLWK